MSVNNDLAVGRQLLDTLGAVGTQLCRFMKQKQAEEAVRESEARKAAVLQSALDAIITIDQDGTIVEFNPMAEKMFPWATGRPLCRASKSPSTSGSPI